MVIFDINSSRENKLFVEEIDLIIVTNNVNQILFWLILNKQNIELWNISFVIIY